MYFPQWSDMGQFHQGVFQSQQMLWQEFRDYFDGTVFDRKLEVEDVDPKDAPLLYPVGLNIVKMICLAQTDAMFGEWEDKILSFIPPDEVKVKPAYLEAIAILDRILQASNAQSTFWELELDRNVLGGGVLKAVPVLDRALGYVRWMRVPTENFYPIFDPDDPDDILEAYLVVPMTKDQANAKYPGLGTSKEIVYRLEHWTRQTYETKVDEVRIDAYSGHNPFGIVPFSYIPRYRSASVWGDSLTQELTRAQDELNARIADIGDAISYNAHPIKWGINLPRSFNTRNFPIGANALWDLGRAMNGNYKPEIGILEAKDPIPNETFQFVDFLYDFARQSAFSPPVVFGDDNGGGQRSGATLEIRMQSLVRMLRRSRSYFTTGVRRMIHITGRILKQKQFSDIGARAVDALLSGEIGVSFAEALPRDHAGIVDEVVKLASTTPPRISLETSAKILGRGISEVEKIKSDLQDKELFPEKQESNDVLEGAQGKLQPQVKKAEDD